MMYQPSYGVFTVAESDSENDSYTDSNKMQKSYTGTDDNGLIPSYQYRYRYQNWAQYPSVLVLASAYVLV